MTNKTLLILVLVLGALFLALNIMVINPAKNQIPNQITTVNPKNISPIDSTETLKNDGSIK